MCVWFTNAPNLCCTQCYDWFGGDEMDDGEFVLVYLSGARKWVVELHLAYQS